MIAGGFRRAMTRAALTLTEFARSNHEPVNVAADGVEMVCPSCKVDWPCPTSVEYTDRIRRLREELAT